MCFSVSAGVFLGELCYVSAALMTVYSLPCHEGPSKLIKCYFMPQLAQKSVNKYIHMSNYYTRTLLHRKVLADFSVCD